MVPNGPKWFNMVKNGEKLSKSPKMVKNGQKWSKWSKMIQNGSKSSNIDQNSKKW